MVYRIPALGGIDWAPTVAALARGQSFALLTHVRADTDGIGSELALHHYLSRQGKRVRILNTEPLDDRLRLLDPARAVEGFHEEDAGDAEYVVNATVVVLDVSEIERLGPLARHVENNRGTTVCIDHHVNDQRRFAAIDVIEPRAPSTGVLVCELLLELGAKLDSVIAQAVYATIVADTGSFRFSNTSSHVMRLAADLIDLGADPQLVHRAVLGSYTAAKTRLLAAALSGVRLECDGKLSWFAVGRELLASLGASPADAEGLVEYLRLGNGVRAAVLLVENGQRQVKVSFRSEDGLDVNRLAQQWGGGGHRHASGATLKEPLDQASARVIAEARTLFR